MRGGAAECSRTQLAGGVRTAGEDPGGRHDTRSACGV